jgi:hypothetical protein
VSLLEQLSDVSESIPGWTVVVLTAILVTLLIAGRVLDMLDTMTTGVEARMRGVVVNPETNQTLGDYMPDYGYRALARGVWATVTVLLGAAVTLLWVGKVVNALRRTGEEL